MASTSTTTSTKYYISAGDEHPTVITCDMALYEKAVQLVDARDDLKRTVLSRLGELHTVMAAGH